MYKGVAKQVVGGGGYGPPYVYVLCRIIFRSRLANSKIFSLAESAIRGKPHILFLFPFYTES